MKITCTAELFVEDGAINGITLRFPDDETCASVMDGRIGGLKYCEDRVIRPFAGGGAELLIGFVKDHYWKRHTFDGRFSDPEER